ncbi:MAG: right-handed parallel beta-helix repeat-containing protein [Kiritimatiellales bacterium]|nr:right-handed parallel beta-helix repeat-containing protein [Kiritimatiellales bacterium]
MQIYKLSSTLLVVLFACFQLCSAGDLTPPSSPGPTMKDLDQVKPGQPIAKSDLPLFIYKPGHYYLTEDIQLDSGKSWGIPIRIDCDNVTVDLMGFTIEGTDEYYAAIYSDVGQRITVKNGVIESFKDYGVYLAGEAGYQNSVSNIKVKNCINGICLGDYSSADNCNLSGISGYGIQVGNNAFVTRCLVSNSKEKTEYGIFCRDYALVSKCIVSFTSFRGIGCSDNSRIEDCMVSESTGDGFYILDGSVITGCTMKKCGIAANSRCLIEKNSIQEASISIGYGSTVRGNQFNGADINPSRTAIQGLYANFIENNCFDSLLNGVALEGGNTVRNNHFAQIENAGIILNANQNVAEGNIILTVGSTTSGIRLNGDKNLYLNNRVSATTPFYISGTGNIDGGGNKTF